jgi:spore cortex biosynthesis protein YabQ
VTLEIQALTMLHMVGAGAYLGAAFDLFSRLRVKKQNHWLIMIQDLLFWLFNGLLVFIWLQSVNEGEMRIYIFLSLLCGYALYKALLQNVFLRMLERCIRINIAIYRSVLRITHALIIKPLQWLYRLTTVLILFVVGVIIQLLNYVYRLILFLIKPLSAALSNLWRTIRKKKHREEKNETLEAHQKKGILAWVAKWLFRK